MKEAIKKMIADGYSYEQIIKVVTEEVITQVLVKHQGNQKASAIYLGMNRGTFRKYLKLMV